MRTCATSARSLATLVAVAALGALGALTGVSAQPAPNLDDLLSRVAARIEEYFGRMQNIICMEKLTAMPISTNMSPDGFARTVESELRVEWEPTVDGAAPTDPNIAREIRKVNGRPPREKDKPKCLDPNPLSPEPLAFLLASHRGEYAFTWAGVGKQANRSALMIDFRPLETGKPEIVDDKRHREDCFSISMPGVTRGRVWIDAATHDVLRVEEHLVSRVDFRVPVKMQRQHSLPDQLVVERYDWSIRYKPVAFQDPEETVLLPETIDQLLVVHGAQSHRTQQAFSEYRRFMTKGRIVKD